MAEILIRDMEMPEACCACPCARHLKCAVAERKPTFVEWYEEKPNWCPIIPIPDHGDLIDRGEVLKMIEKAKQNDSDIADVYEDDYMVVKEWMAVAPTVIPAEPPKEAE